MSQANLISALRGGQPSAPGATTLQPGFTMFGNQPSTMPQTLQMPGLGNFGQNMLMGVPQTQAARTAMPGSAAARAAALRNPLGEPLEKNFFVQGSGMSEPVDMRQHGAFYNQELADPTLSKNLARDMGRAQVDASASGGLYQQGDLNPFFAPNWNNEGDVKQFARYYNNQNPYFSPDVLDVDPHFSAYRSEKAKEEMSPDESRALYERLFRGQMIAGNSDRRRDPQGVDDTWRGLLDAQANKQANQQAYGQAVTRNANLLAGSDVAHGRLTSEQGHAIRVAKDDAAAFAGQQDVVDFMGGNIAEAQKRLDNYQWDKTKSDSWNRNNIASLQRTIDGYNAAIERANAKKQRLGASMAPYAQTLAGVTDLSGLSSADAIRAITGALRDGAEQASTLQTAPAPIEVAAPQPVQQPMAVEAEAEPAPTQAARPTKTIEDRLAALNPKSRTYAQQRNALLKLQRQAQINALRG